eukprot:COSAG06_NODE_1918_length_8067_cov_10.737952_11_plen_87_part_00
MRRCQSRRAADATRTASPAASAALPVSSLINLPLSRALTVLLLLDALRCHTAAHHPASAPARAASLINLSLPCAHTALTDQGLHLR